jgi:hypothetical protein
MADEIITTTTAPAAPATSAAAALTPVPAAPVVAPANDNAAPAPTEAPKADGLALPGKDATPEQWGQFWDAVGRPAKAEDYGLTVREGEDPEFVTEVAATMRELGLTKEQGFNLQQKLEAKALERFEKQETARIAALDAKNTAEQQELKAELGDKFDGNMELAKRAVRQFGGAEQAADIITAIEDKLGYKATMKFFMDIGKGLGEHDAGGQGGQGSQPGERLPTAQVLYGSGKQ